MSIDEVIGNLKTYEILNKFGKLEAEPKAKKNLVLKATKTTYAEDEKTTYISKRVLKDLEKSGAISRIWKVCSLNQGMPNE